ncbi:DUF2752 domain-containing protein [Chryseobacterium sp. MDT2-18]|uniref:DUF2752 domain-containing protein n=1 Tax=Chryseobacterium sp. MDT2-18 TaxID=1259136 RepID=UPI0027830DD4|nr:DUF2752 domain-containing protein [Chryseobacterium sp. MDT2-18]MDQ0476651.1 hypothetical protein [Chryseobacterium sp. MDT2-18]
MVRRNLQISIYFTFAILLGLLYYFYNPAYYQLFPNCIFKSLTGLSCPGCGAQRATHELLHLNFKNAFAYNPLLVVSLPYALAGLLLYQTKLKERFPKTKQFLYGQKAILIVLLMVILFFIFRNL